MTVRTLALVFAVALALWLAATFPLRFALGFADASQLGLAAHEVTGTVWSGALHEARFHGIMLGDVSVRLDPRSIFTGNPQFIAENAEGRLTIGLREGARIDQAEGQL
jgi:general secretion pathway protein N